MHEIKNDILQDYTGDFELNGKMIIGPIELLDLLKTKNRFKNTIDFKSYINAKDVNYDSEDVFLLVTFINWTRFNSKLWKEVPINVLNICKKLVNNMGKTVIYLLQECVLSSVLNILLKKIILKNF